MRSSSSWLLLLLAAFLVTLAYAQEDFSCVLIDDSGRIFRLGPQGSSLIGDSGFRGTSSLAWDGDASLFYSYTEHGELLALDPVTGTGRTLKLFLNSPVITGLAYYRGTLFGLSAKPEPTLWALRKPLQDSAWREVGRVGAAAKGAADLAADPDTGLLWTMSPEHGLLAVDPTTGHARHVEGQGAGAGLTWRAVAPLSSKALLAVADRGAATLYRVDTLSGETRFMHLLDRSRVRGMHCLHATKPAATTGTGTSTGTSKREARQTAAPNAMRRTITFPDANQNNGLTIAGPLGVVETNPGAEPDPVLDVTETRYKLWDGDAEPQGVDRGIEWDVVGTPARLRVNFQGSGFYSLGPAASICDVQPSAFVDVNPPYGGERDLSPTPGYAYVTSLGTREAGSNSYLLIWVDHASAIGRNVLRLEYEWWMPGATRPQGTDCLRPRLLGLGPQLGWPSGQKVWFVGKDLGDSSLDLHKFDVVTASGPVECVDPKLEVSRHVVSCLLKGAGVVLPITGAVNGAAITTSGIHYSFANFDPPGLTCDSSSYPSRDGSTCLCVNDHPCAATDPEEEITPEARKNVDLTDVLSGVMAELNLAQRDADDHFQSLAEAYKTGDMNKLSVQRFTMPSAEFSTTMTIEKAGEAVVVNPVTRHGAEVEVSRLARVRMTIRSEQARWITVFDAARNATSYTLDI